MNQICESHGLHQSNPRFAGSSKLISNVCASCFSSDAGGTWRRDTATDDNLCNSCGLRLARKRRKVSQSIPPVTKTAKTGSPEAATRSDPSPMNSQILKLYILLGSVIFAQAQNQAKATVMPSSSLSEPNASSMPDPFAQPSSAASAGNPDEMDAYAAPKEDNEVQVKKNSLMLSSSSYGSLFDLLLSSKSLQLD